MNCQSRPTVPQKRGAGVTTRARHSELLQRFEQCFGFNQVQGSETLYETSMDFGKDIPRLRASKRVIVMAILATC